MDDDIEAERRAHCDADDEDDFKRSSPAPVIENKLFMGKGKDDRATGSRCSKYLVRET
jgi:hypothetical protein